MLVSICYTDLDFDNGYDYNFVKQIIDKKVLNSRWVIPIASASDTVTGTLTPNLIKIVVALGRDGLENVTRLAFTLDLTLV